VSWETGLGGKFDSTNIIGAKSLDLTCITSIGFDHKEILGDTLEKIQENKAGIIKQGVPILIGNTVDAQPIEKLASELKCELFKMKEFLGDYELENKALVKKAGHILKEKYNFEDFVDRAFQEPVIGRFQKISPERIRSTGLKFKDVIVDVGHNP